MMLSYLMDLIHLIRLTTTNPTKNNQSNIQACMERLHEMRIAFTKMRPMEKKLRYQIDKLLSFSSDVFSYMDNDEIEQQQQQEQLHEEYGDEDDNKEDDDPLSYKPNIDAFDDVEEDNDLKQVKETMDITQKKQTPQIYKPPRLFSTGTESLSQKEKKEQKQKRRQQQKMKHNTELVHALQSQYTDMPEEDDMAGGVHFINQSSTSIHSTGNKRKIQMKDLEKTKFEEDHFIRLQPTRKEKKERNRIIAQERSNLHDISDLGNVTRGITAFTQDQDQDQPKSLTWEGRYDNGKRKRGLDMDQMGTKRINGKSKYKMKTNNPLQKELYGIRDQNSKKKKKR